MASRCPDLSGFAVPRCFSLVDRGTRLVYVLVQDWVLVGGGWWRVHAAAFFGSEATIGVDHGVNRRRFVQPGLSGFFQLDFRLLHLFASEREVDANRQGGSAPVDHKIFRKQHVRRASMGAHLQARFRCG